MDYLSGGGNLKEPKIFCSGIFLSGFFLARFLARIRGKLQSRKKFRNLNLAPKEVHPKLGPKYMVAKGVAIKKIYTKYFTLGHKRYLEKISEILKIPLSHYGKLEGTKV